LSSGRVSRFVFFDWFDLPSAAIALHPACSNDTQTLHPTILQTHLPVLEAISGKLFVGAIISIPNTGDQLGYPCRLLFWVNRPNWPASSITVALGEGGIKKRGVALLLTRLALQPNSLSLRELLSFSPSSIDLIGAF
jgi:hypothetical protein